MMTKQEAISSGAVKAKEFKDGHVEAVFSNVGDMARFAAELRKRQILYKERFTESGKAIRFCWGSGN